ncbi:hypothetical protein [Fodinicola feengrottensis]|uniref:hypothetical protein n=1 Tax=Fodinicola feengrottensis TaxID=435914 RepID=UPI0013D2694B|nr:hypothetical protein [Fodinicola feengrottensis]
MSPRNCAIAGLAFAGSRGTRWAIAAITLALAEFGVDASICASSPVRIVVPSWEKSPAFSSNRSQDGLFGTATYGGVTIGRGE